MCWAQRSISGVIYCAIGATFYAVEVLVDVAAKILNLIYQLQNRAEVPPSCSSSPAAIEMLSSLWYWSWFNWSTRECSMTWDYQIHNRCSLVELKAAACQMIEGPAAREKSRPTAWGPNYFPSEYWEGRTVSIMKYPYKNDRKLESGDNSIIFVQSL